MGMMSLFTNPAEAIMQAKATRSMGTAILLLLIVSVLLAISAGVTTAVRTSSYSSYGYGSYYRPQTEAGGIVISAFVTFMGVFLGGLFLGYLTSVAMKTLSGTGGFFEGVASIAYSIFVPGITLFVAGLLSLGGAASRDATAMSAVTLLGAVLILWGAILGFATLYRSLKELFSTDMITAYVGAGVLTLGVVVVFYYMLATAMMPYISMMGIGL